MGKKKLLALMLTVNILVISTALTACSERTSASGNTLGNETEETQPENDNLKNDTSVSFENISEGAFTGSVIDIENLFSDRDLSGEYKEKDSCRVITLADNASSSDSKNVEIDENTITIKSEGTYILSGTLSNGMVAVDAGKSEKIQIVLDGVNINSATSAAIYVKKADKVFVILADGSTNTLSNGGTFEAIDDNNIDAVIFSKDDLTLNGTGSLKITSNGGHGIVSKDDLVITNGTYDITAGSHGISGKDSVAIADGTFNIKAGKDGVHSANDDDDTAGYVYIANGNFNFDVESDGISAMNEVNVAGGNINIIRSKEGIEARLVNISGGNIDIVSSDDGLNATDKRNETKNKDKANENGGSGFMHKNPMGNTAADANINISGGIVKIDAEGDGIDSNGYLTVSGGEVYVAGPSNGGNAALDYDISAVITGGIVFAAGQSDMAQNFGAASTQGSILVNLDGQQQADTDIALFDSDGNELVKWTMEKKYNSAVVSCPEIVDGGSYTFKTGTEITEITMDGLIYGNGFGSGGGFGNHGGGGRGGFGNHGGGGQPDGMPDFKDGERPDGMPDFKDGEKPDGMPDFKNGESPDGMPGNGRGGRKGFDDNGKQGENNDNSDKKGEQL